MQNNVFGAVSFIGWRWVSVWSSLNDKTHCVVIVTVIGCVTGRCDGCKGLVHNLEEQVLKANMRQDKRIQLNNEMEQEVRLTGLLRHLHHYDASSVYNNPYTSTVCTVLWTNSWWERLSRKTRPQAQSPFSSLLFPVGGGGRVTAPINSRKDHMRRGSVELM